MPENTVIPPVNSINFEQIKESLKIKLQERLEEEVAMNEFENAPEGDLWELPVVDSKTVIKLSPIVEEMTGRKIKPEWIQPGGYDSVNEAITDLIEKISDDCSK